MVVLSGNLFPDRRLSFNACWHLMRKSIASIMLTVCDGAGHNREVELRAAGGAAVAAVPLGVHRALGRGAGRAWAQHLHMAVQPRQL